MTLYLAGGCFWGVEKYFNLINPHLITRVGYANGTIENPTYEQVCSNDYDFAEVVELKDISEQDLKKIIKSFFKVVDPFAINKQGHDIGLQYRSGIYTNNWLYAEKIKQIVSDLFQDQFHLVKTEIMPIKNFYPAEDYHQKYLDKNPKGYCHINLEPFKGNSNA